MSQGRGAVLPRDGGQPTGASVFFAADTSTQTTPLLPFWSAVAVSAGASLSSTTVPPAATAAAIRCSATSVASTHRGRGTASALQAESMRRFAAAGMHAAALGVDAANRSNALRLYESLGYRQTASTCVHQVTHPGT